MKSILLVLATWLVSCGIGRTIVDYALGRYFGPVQVLKPCERFLFASAVGLGVIAYGVLGLGLTGHLSLPFLAGWLLVAAVAGFSGLRSTWRDAASHIRSVRAVGEKRAPMSGLRIVCTAMGAVVAALLLLDLAASFQPPGPHAWDALAYHLADPKVYLQHQRILLLPTEHHSNFPFTMEMLFTIGLAFDGYVAAQLFHLLAAALLVLSIICFCDRFLTRLAGLTAALIFVTTPLVLWEATVAYIDLGLALYVFLAAYALMFAVRISDFDETFQETGKRSVQTRLMALGGIALGFALGIKYLALLPLAFLAAIGIARRLPRRGLVQFILIACVIGSPWYIKNEVWMHNPVYPFAFNVFSGSRYWSADRATPYAEEQRSFGTAHDVHRPVESLRNLALTPWKMLANPEIYTNPADFTFTSLIGGLYAGFMLSLVFVERKPGFVLDLTSLVLLLFVSWFFVSQHIRYLIPILPFASVVCGYAASHWLGSAPFVSHDSADVPYRAKIVNTVGWIVTAAALVGQVAIVGWGISALPQAGQAAIKAREAGLEPTALSAPESLSDLFRPDRRNQRSERLNSYEAIGWINEHAPAGAGIILYEDVLGYYLDRPYLWGNGEHSSYIPYESMRTGQDLTIWLNEHGIQYALINLNYSPSNPHILLPDDNESVEAILRQWYPAHGLGWRRILGDAIQSGEWEVLYAHHGAAVLQIGRGPR